MPRYFFNIFDHGTDRDEEGVELSGPKEARVQAVIFAGDYLSDHPELVEDEKLVIEVRDESHTVLLTVTMTAEEPGERQR